MHMDQTYGAANRVQNASLMPYRDMFGRILTKLRTQSNDQTDHRCSIWSIQDIHVVSRAAERIWIRPMEQQIGLKMPDRCYIVTCLGAY